MEVREVLSVDEFVEAVIPDLARYAAGLTGSREGAHDVVADALLYVIGHWDRIGQWHDLLPTRSGW